MKKRILSLILAMCLLLALCPAALAADSTTISAESSAATVRPGDTFTVTVRISETANLGGLQMRMNYDSSELTCLRVENGGAVPVSDMPNSSGGLSIETDGSHYYISAIATITGSYDLSKPLFIATFQVEAGAAGDVSPVLAMNTGDFFDSEYADIPFSLVQPQVSVGEAAIAPVITTESLPDAVTGRAYAQTLTASGTAPISWSLSSGSLPEGLSLNASGLISGSPTKAGDFRFTVQAKNGAGSITKSLTIHVAAAPQPLTFTHSAAFDVPSGQVNTPVAAISVASGVSGGSAPYTFSKQSGPAWLAVSAAGSITGMRPAAAEAASSAVIQVTDRDGASKTIRIQVGAVTEAAAEPPVIVTTALPDGTVGKAYSAVLAATGDTPITWGITSGKLPDGLILNAATGKISGTPTKSGVFAFTLSAANDAGTAKLPLTITVQEKGGGSNFPILIGGGSAVQLPTTPMAFKDVKSTDWFYNDVKYVYDNGLMNGTSTTKFSPSSTLTRAMVVTILHRVEGAPAIRYNGVFADVPNYQWYSEAVEWAAMNEIVNGYSSSKFGPNDAVTREQLATILYRYAQYKDFDVSGSASLDDVKDSNSVAAYARPAMKWAVQGNMLLVTGGKLQPKSAATRAQVAAAVAAFHRTYLG